MKKLSKDWITEKYIDFEYKKYILLAYLKEVSENFDQTKLYPYLADLIEHYRNIVSIKENKESIYNSFPKRADGADLEKFKLIYTKIVEDDDLMQAIESIIHYSIPKFEYYLSEGKKIYDFIEERLMISPVGISPLNAFEGYLFLKNGSNKETQVYEYQITIFEDANEKYRGIHTHYLTTYTKNFINTYESIKTELIRYNKKLPNPATYVIESEITFPAEETLLPVAKRVLVKYLAVTSYES